VESRYPYFLVAEGPLGRWLLRRQDSGCGRIRSSSETSPSAEDYNEKIVIVFTCVHFQRTSLNFNLQIVGCFLNHTDWGLQGTFPIENINNPSKFHMVMEKETRISKEIMQGKAYRQE
jgi:hypothetical protein